MKGVLRALFKTHLNDLYTRWTNMNFYIRYQGLTEMGEAGESKGDIAIMPRALPCLWNASLLWSASVVSRSI